MKSKAAKRVEAVKRAEAYYDKYVAFRKYKIKNTKQEYVGQFVRREEK